MDIRLQYKRVISIMLIVCLSVGLCACQKKAEQITTETEADVQPTEEMVNDLTEVEAETNEEAEEALDGILLSI